ncbi:hypothetical protein F4778DRAFT_753132 [Xylariomycetidae sp. FL2044]|nr:hypothetical protein F4778DRAFT_753132 [Xylariomycetidae sp. FL2044]
MAVDFDISPEKEASKIQFLYRQIFVRPLKVPQNVDLSGKTVIVTGSNQGVGLECARQLVELGVSKLILAVRDESKGDLARAQLSSRTDTTNLSIEVWKLDYLSYESITSFVERARSLDRLDIVILNAGIYRTNRVINTGTGHEEDVQVNYLSTSLLAILFLPLLKAKNAGGQPGRLVFVSSDTAAWARFPQRDSDPLLPELDKETKKFDFAERYGLSKLLAQLFLVELAKRVPPSVAIINAANPGLCRGSGLARDTDGTLLGFIVAFFGRLYGRTCSAGGTAIIDAAIQHGEESHGHYLEDGKLTPFAPLVYKPEATRITERLWGETMKEFAFAGAEGIIQDLSNS